METEAGNVEKKEWHRPRLTVLRGSETLNGTREGFVEGSKGGFLFEVFAGDTFGEVAPSG